MNPDFQTLYKFHFEKYDDDSKAYNSFSHMVLVRDFTSHHVINNFLARYVNYETNQK